METNKKEEELLHSVRLCSLSGILSGRVRYTLSHLGKEEMQISSG